MSNSSTKRKPRTAAPDPVFDAIQSALHNVEADLAKAVPVVRTTRRKAVKARKPGSILPNKPYPDYPLTPHSSGKWYKKITVNGKPTAHYFGRWGRMVKGKMERLPGDGWQDALALYKAQADDLHAGRTPRVNKTGDGLTLRDLCNRFRTAKLRQQQAGEIALATYNGYVAIADFVIEQFGKDRLIDDVAADDFEALRAEMSKRWGPVRLGNQVQSIRSVFKYGYEAGLIEKPIRYGPQFKKPSASVLRRHKAKNGEKMLEAAQLRRLLDVLTGKETDTGRTNPITGKPHTVSIKANPAIRAMVLLGVNCGFNNKDCADLPLSALDLDGGWINFPRPKTGIPRRCPLWPETVAALREAIAVRPKPQDDEAAKLVFLLMRGGPWICKGQANPVSVIARDAMKAIAIHREGIGPGVFRHVFETIGGGKLDQVAVNHIMGHADNSIAANYRERIDDSRLKAVTDHVHDWLFPAPVKEGGA